MSSPAPTQTSRDRAFAKARSIRPAVQCIHRGSHDQYALFHVAGSVKPYLVTRETDGSMKCSCISTAMCYHIARVEIVETPRCSYCDTDKARSDSPLCEGCESTLAQRDAEQAELVARQRARIALLEAELAYQMPGSYYR